MVTDGGFGQDAIVIGQTVYFPRPRVPPVDGVSQYKLRALGGNGNCQNQVTLPFGQLPVNEDRCAVFTGGDGHEAFFLRREGLYGDAGAPAFGIVVIPVHDNQPGPPLPDNQLLGIEEELGASAIYGYKKIYRK